MMVFDEATRRQIRAAAPDRSTWLAANAGSGKTRVLTDRVARLLFANVAPQNILCLTYTKSAASEMQNRLFQRLGEWTLMQDDALAQALTSLGVETRRDASALAKARRLFAAAVETPGGLKIQTIHSFCAGVLRRFPLEAGIEPNFQEIDDRRARQLRLHILEQMVEGPEIEQVDALARYVSDATLDQLLVDISNNAALFRHDIAEDSTYTSPGAEVSYVIAPGDAEVVAAMLPGLQDSGVQDQKLAAALTQVSWIHPTERDQARLESTLLFGATAKAPFAPKIGAIPTKALRTGALEMHMAAFEALMKRVAEFRTARLKRLSASKTTALRAFAHRFIKRYAKAKSARGWLDFDDLINKTRTLLTDRALAQWVLYRLDGGIDHILVDEAQDTSPAQWDVIWKLAEEFTAGRSARDTARTIFVVGDKKQSIYSFQGADPGGFDRMRDRFSKALIEVDGPPLQELQLEHSFRSAPAILKAVDSVFEGRRSGLGQDSHHLAFKSNLPGRIDLWPQIDPTPPENDENWDDPVDRMAPEQHVPQLARHIAMSVREMIGGEGRAPLARPKVGADGLLSWESVTPGDILILLPRRSPLFQEIIRACKREGIPLAGSDQIRLGAELAVRDIVSLLRFLSLAEDDLSLAEALKSPLFGWDEQALFSLAHGRPGYLWEALRNDPNHAETRLILDDLRAQVEFLRPYELIERLLNRHGGRRRILARLGAEAEEGLDVLLSQALAYEQAEVPTLVGFIGWLSTDDLTVKRTVDSSRDELRVMTIHGAKGLEAPVVFLPDTIVRRTAKTGDVLSDGQKAFWSMPRAESPEHVAALIDEERMAAERERQRLLYVALTRAESWLIVAAAGDVGKTPEASWYRQIEAGLSALSLKEINTPAGPGKRYEPDPWEISDVSATVNENSSDVTEPLWLHLEAPAVRPAAARISPSDLPGAKAFPGDEGEANQERAKARGEAVHKLLEHLPRQPRDDWNRFARRLVGDLAQEALAEAHRCLDTPALGHLFAPDTLAEVDIAAQVSGQQIFGTIDRLVVSEEHVLAVDFKSNRVVPPRPELIPAGILAQLGAYGAALTQVFPDREIGLAVLWTRSAMLMRVDNRHATAALTDALGA